MDEILQTGVITDLQSDPAGEHRIQVRLPMADASEVEVWARLATLDPAIDRSYPLSVGDEVVVGLLDADPAQRVVLGRLGASARFKPPVERADDKGCDIPDRLEVTFGDSGKVMTVKTAAGGKVTLSEESGALVLADRYGNSISIGEEGITITSAEALKLGASSALMVQGNAVTLSAEGAFEAGGRSATSLISSGVVVVKGAMVRIN